MQATAQNGFEIKEAVADKAYLSRDNYALVEELDGQAFIPFKKDVLGKPRGKSHIWRKMFNYSKGQK